MDAFANLKGGIDAKRLIGGAIRVDNVKSAARPLFDIFNLDKLQQQQTGAAATNVGLDANSSTFSDRGSLLRSNVTSAADLPALQPASSASTFSRPTGVQVTRVSSALPSQHHVAQPGALARVQVKNDAASIARAAEDALLRDLQDAGVDVGDLLAGPAQSTAVSRRPSRTGTGTGLSGGVHSGAGGAIAAAASSSTAQGRDMHASAADSSTTRERDPQPSDIFAGFLPDARSAGALAGALKRAATGVASTAATAVAAGAGTGGALSSAFSVPLGAVGALGAGLSSFPSLQATGGASSTSASHYAAGQITRTGGPSAVLPSSSGAWAQRGAGPGAGDARLAAALAGQGGVGGGDRRVDLGDGQGPTTVTVIKASGGPGLNPASLSSSSAGGASIASAVLSSLLALCAGLLGLIGVTPERLGAGGPKALLAAFGAIVLVAWMYLMMQSASEP